jgi:hypothetical protein
MLNSKQAIRNLSLLICALFFVTLIMGCASFKETVKGFAGVSTKVLEDNRKTAVTRIFNHDYNACYNKMEEALKSIGAYIYAKDKAKHMFAIYVSEKDTTPVGLFLKDIDKEHTQIEVSSPSSYAKEMIAAKFFPALELSLALEKEEHKVQGEK